MVGKGSDPVNGVGKEERTRTKDELAQGQGAINGGDGVKKLLRGGQDGPGLTGNRQFKCWHHEKAAWAYRRKSGATGKCKNPGKALMSPEAGYGPKSS